MVCRKWDINAITGCYLSTNFLISDGRGDTMHCTAKAKTAHTFVTKLKEGNIYTINQFVVRPNTEEYRITKKSAYIIEFHSGITIRRSLVKSDGFVRHPFGLIAFDDLQVTDNKYLIDVGYITNVGRSIQQKSGSRTLDFYLTNGSEIQESMEIIPAKNSEARDGTSENLLIWPVTARMRTRKGWNYASCGSDKSRWVRQEGKENFGVTHAISRLIILW
ncbi:hypothetical protein OROHE_014292 [Orobanche hederae]